MFLKLLIGGGKKMKKRFLFYLLFVFCLSLAFASLIFCFWVQEDEFLFIISILVLSVSIIFSGFFLLRLEEECNKIDKLDFKGGEKNARDISMFKM